MFDCNIWLQVAKLSDLNLVLLPDSQVQWFLRQLAAGFPLEFATSFGNLTSILGRLVSRVAQSYESQTGLGPTAVSTHSDKEQWGCFTLTKKVETFERMHCHKFLIILWSNQVFVDHYFHSLCRLHRWNSRIWRYKCEPGKCPLWEPAAEGTKHCSLVRRK